MTRKLLDEIKRVAEEYSDDYRKLKKEMNPLISEGQKRGDSVAVGSAYYQLAIACFYQSDDDGVFTNAFKAVSLLRGLDEYELLANSLNALGFAYSEQENEQFALMLYDEALSIVKKHRIKGSAKSLILNNMCSCYHNMGDCKTAIRILNECIKQVDPKTPDDYSNLAIYSLNLAEFHKDSGEIQKSMEILSSMESWINKVDFTQLIPDYFIRSAIISYLLGNIKDGDRNLDNAFTLMPKDMFPKPIYDDLQEISGLLLKNGDKTRAKKILELMVEYEKNEPDTTDLIIIYRAYAGYYMATGDNKQAALYYEKLDELNKKRIKEQAAGQLRLYKKIKAADVEVHKLQKKMKASENMLTREPLTGLLNRSALLEVSGEFIREAARKKKKVGAIFLDIDFFKECNDTYGHAKGDEIIKTVAEACRAEVKSNVRFARYGGDEFFGITWGLEDSDLIEAARRICSRIQSENIPHIKNPNGKIVTMSAGVVNVPVSGRTDTIIEIANYADKALYYAKNNGRNSIYWLGHDSNKDNKGTAFVKIDF